MPEGHTIHRLAGIFAELFEGEHIRVSSPQGRFTAGAALVDGRRLGRVEAFGKQMFLGFDGPGNDPMWVRVHLGLYGAWTFAGDGSTVVEHAIGAPRRRVGEQESAAAVTASAGTAAAPDASAAVQSDPNERFIPAEPRGQVRARVLGRHAVADLAGPTACEVITEPERAAVVAKLGPDPLRTDADPQRFIDRVRRSRTAVGVQLMNQNVIAGVGNIYRAEVLFRVGLDPMRPGTQVPAEVLQDIWDDLAVLMADGVRTGRILTTDPEDRGKGHERGEMDPRRVRQNTDDDPEAISRNESFYVYHRDGLACRRCGTPVLVRQVAARNLFWCPGCQV